MYNVFIGTDGVGTGLTSRGSRSTTRTQLTNEKGNITILIVNHAVYNLFIGTDGVGTGLTSRGSRSTTCTQPTNEKGKGTLSDIFERANYFIIIIIIIIISYRYWTRCCNMYYKLHR